MAVFTAMILLLLEGCASQSPNEPWNHPDAERQAARSSGEALSPRTVGVLGMVGAADIGQRFDRMAAARQIAAALRGRAGVSVMPLDEIYPVLGAGPYTEVMGHLASKGSFSASDMQKLQAPGLPSRMLVTRIESDTSEHLPLETDPNVHVRDALLNNRQRLTYNTRRNVVVTGAVLDVRSGRLLWQKSYRARPMNTRVYDQYLGSNFSTSLAAAFANAMVNGIKRPSYPEPPPLSVAIDAIAQEIARTAPL